MTRSMTAYTRAEVSGSWGRLSCELRSVNHRYLDLQFKLPDELQLLESELRPAASAVLSRGKVDCALRLQRAAAAAAAIELDPERLEQLRAALDRINEALQATSVPDPLRVLAYPGVVREESRDTAPLFDAARSLFRQVVDDFVATRDREGGRLASYLLDRCDAVSGLVGRVRARFASVRGQWLERLRQRSRELGAELDAARVEQELVLQLQRIDIEEELSRLASHLLEVRAALARSEPVGRRLDFLMQELNREANTLSSKSQDAEMTHLAVDMKVLIEQMREQVQNLE